MSRLIQLGVPMSCFPTHRASGPHFLKFTALDGEVMLISAGLALLSIQSEPLPGRRRGTTRCTRITYVVEGRLGGQMDRGEFFVTETPRQVVAIVNAFSAWVAEQEAAERRKLEREIHGDVGSVGLPYPVSPAMRRAERMLGQVMKTVGPMVEDVDDADVDAGDAGGKGDGTRAWDPFAPLG